MPFGKKIFVARCRLSLLFNGKPYVAMRRKTKAKTTKPVIFSFKVT